MTDVHEIISQLNDKITELVKEVQNEKAKYKALTYDFDDLAKEHNSKLASCYDLQQKYRQLKQGLEKLVTKSNKVIISGLCDSLLQVIDENINDLELNSRLTLIIINIQNETKELKKLLDEAK